MTKVIAISNQKGGVGKTTTSINLASYLSQLNHKVLIIDFDPQGNCTSGLGISKTSSIKTIYQGLITNISLDELILNTSIANLYIIPSSIDLSGAEVELPLIDNYEKILLNKISSLKTKFNFILIDCPPALGLLTINALVAASSVLIPLQCEFFALEGMSQLLDTIKMVRTNLNNKLKIEGILPTMYDVRNNISRQVLEELQTHFNDFLLKTIIPRNVRLSEAPSHGMPISIYDNNSKGAYYYRLLADEISQLNLTVTN